MKSRTGVLNKIFGKKQPSGEALEKALAAILTIESKMAAAAVDLAMAREALDDSAAAGLAGTAKTGAEENPLARLTEKREELAGLARLLAAARLEAQGVLVVERETAVAKLSATEAEIVSTLRKIDWRRIKKIAELTWAEDLGVEWPTTNAAGRINLPVFALSLEEVTAVAEKAAEAPRQPDSDADKLADLRARLHDLNAVYGMPPEMALDLLLSRRRRR